MRLVAIFTMLTAVLMLAVSVIFSSPAAGVTRQRALTVDGYYLDQSTPFTAKEKRVANRAERALERKKPRLLKGWSYARVVAHSQSATCAKEGTNLGDLVVCTDGLRGKMGAKIRFPNVTPVG